MTYTEALATASSHDESQEWEGRIVMKRWTRWLPQWAFEKSLDFSLLGLRRDMLRTYQSQSPWSEPC